MRGFRNLVRGLGYDIVRFDATSNPAARQARVLELYDINVVLDVGANIGQTGRRLRARGYNGKIISFEPLTSAYEQLKKESSNDKLWEIHNFALGKEAGTVTINIAGNSGSSSILDMLPITTEVAPESKYIGHEEIQVQCLDSLFPSLCNPGDRVYLKMDVQGFEDAVLQGAQKSLDCIDTVQLEMSLVSLYEGQLLFPEMYKLLSEMGYSPISFDPEFIDEQTGQLLQLDGTFHRFVAGEK